MSLRWQSIAADTSLPRRLAAAHFVRPTTETVGPDSTLEYPNATFLSLAINESGYIFAGGDPLGGPVGVLRSTDNGDTWQPVNNGLTTGNGINALIATANGYLFAGSYGDGVFRSTDNGDNWTQVNNGLTTPFVLSFTSNASGDIFAGTYFGGGVFRSTDNGRHVE